EHDLVDALVVFKGEPRLPAQRADAPGRVGPGGRQLQRLAHRGPKRLKRVGVAGHGRDPQARPEPAMHHPTKSVRWGAAQRAKNKVKEEEGGEKKKKKGGKKDTANSERRRREAYTLSS